MLGRIRRANAVAAAQPGPAARPGPAAPGPGDPPAYRVAGELGPAALMGLLAGRLEDYRALVRRAGSGGVAGEIAAALERRGARRVVVPGTLSLPGLASPAEVAAAVPDIDVVVDDGLSAADLDEMDGAVTGAAVAIAETGTIVLDAAAGRRAITLVPDYHLCVVTAGQVVHIVPEAIARLAGPVPPSGALTWISGPSATSDIELRRVEGVHGPRTLEVILAAEG
jgi:L-lactate dehydrogenase complex protein LldG